MDKWEIIFEEYRNANMIVEKYYDRIYHGIQYTLVFYGASAALLKDLNVYLVLFIVPVATYVLGLFYIYNIGAILKQGYFLMKLEGEIKRMCGKEDPPINFQGWHQYAKKDRMSSILAYGTVAMLYLLSPLFIIAFSVFYNVSPINLSGAEVLKAVTSMNPYHRISLVFYGPYFLFWLILLIKALGVSKNIKAYKQVELCASS